MLQNKRLYTLQIIWIQRLEKKFSIRCFDWSFDIFVDFLSVATKYVAVRRHLRPLKLQDALAFLKFDQPFSPIFFTQASDISLQGNFILRELLCELINFPPG